MIDIRTGPVLESLFSDNRLYPYGWDMYREFENKMREGGWFTTGTDMIWNLICDKYYYGVNPFSTQGFITIEDD